MRTAETGPMKMSMGATGMHMERDATMTELADMLSGFGRRIGGYDGAQGEVSGGAGSLDGRFAGRGEEGGRECGDDGRSRRWWWCGVQHRGSGGFGSFRRA